MWKNNPTLTPLMLYDSDGNDLLQGLGGNDTLLATRGGNDRLEGGEGDDRLEGGSSRNNISYNLCNRSVEGSETRLPIHQGNSIVLVKDWAANETVWKGAA